jgi:methyltransferase (TIGR00027 family)
VWAAVARALGAREADARVRNPDWLAEKLVGREEIALLGNDPLAVAFADPAAEGDARMHATVAARILIPRTRFIDAGLEAAVRNGAGQVVIMGAGFDSRAYRFAEMLSDTRVFEVDKPAMQRRKRRRVLEAFGEAPANVTYVPVDFRFQKLGDALVEAGYNPDRKTFFIWEGCVVYLPEDAVRGTLRWIAGHAAPGSAVIFDYAHEARIRMHQKLVLHFDHLPEEMKRHFRGIRDVTADEPWIFGMPDRGEEAFLRDVGLELRKVMGMDSAEAVKKYLTRADGSVFGSMAARERQSYFILEAGVAGEGKDEG